MGRRVVGAHYRLRSVHSALTAAPARAPETDALAQQLSQGELDVRGLPATTLRLLMQPEHGAPTVTEQTLAAQPLDIGIGAEPRPLLDPATGRLLNLEWLEGLRDAAVAANEFHRAAAIHDILMVLRPKPPLSLCDTAPAGIDAKAQFFLDNGFVCVENVLSGESLARVQAAWAEAEAPSKASWLEARRHNSGIARHSFTRADEGHPVVSRKYFGITGLTYGSNTSLNPAGKPFLELDPAFIDLIHNDSSPGSEELWQVAERVLVGPAPGDLELFRAGLEAPTVGNPKHPRGSTQRGGSVRCTGCGPRTYVPDADRKGYTYWHRDTSRPDAWPVPSTRTIKAFIYIHDVSENGGPLSVVPGSHRLACGPWETLRTSFKSSMTLDAATEQTKMPNHYKFVARAGTALLFDTACWCELPTIRATY